MLGVWWKRTTKQGAIAGILAGFGVTLFYLVITRYWPHIGVQYFGMVSNLNPITGAPLISADAMKAALYNPALLDRMVPGVSSRSRVWVASHRAVC